MRILFLLLLLAYIPCRAQHTNEHTVAINTTSVIKLSPAIIYLNLDKGQDTTIVVNITNNKTKVYDFKISLKDWERDTAGDKVYYAAGSYKRSCAQWIRLDEDYISVKPGEQKGVKFRVNVPENDNAANQMKWTMLVLELVDKSKEAEENPVSVTTLLGVHIYQTPPNPKFIKKITLTDLTYNNNKCRLVTGNIGDLQVHCEAKMELVAENGKTITLQDISTPMLPDQLQYLEFAVPDNIEPGSYKAIASVYVDNDKKPTEKMEKTIEIK